MKPKKRNKLISKLKKGNTVVCIKDVVDPLTPHHPIIFQKNNEYKITDVMFGSTSSGNDTIYYVYYVYYIVDGKTFTTNETFIVNEKSYGGSGASGYGKFEEHFIKK